MVMCAVATCSTKSGKDKDVAFFRFPKSSNLRKAWIFKCRRKHYVPSEHARVCEHHFLDSDFVRSRSFAASVGLTHKIKLQLKPDAIPSVISEPTNVSTPLRKKHKSPRKSKAVEKRRRLELVQKFISQETMDIGTNSNVSDEVLASQCENAGTSTMDEEQPVSNHKNVSMQTDNRVNKRNVKLQVEVGAKTCHNQSCQTDISYDNNNESKFSESWLMEQNANDDEWLLSDDCDEETVLASVEEEISNFGSTSKSPHEEKKYLVFESELEVLTDYCRTCGRQQSNKKKVTTGTALTISFDCACGEKFYWSSQPCSGSMPFGNLLLAAAIMFAGGSPFQMLNMLQHLNVASISKRTYFRMQKLYLVPCIQELYLQKQQQLFCAVLETGNSVRVAGDGRCCSPGHTAKYGSYSLLDVDTGKVLVTQLVQSNEVSNSYNMELEGLKRSMATLDEANIRIAHLLTDRHSQVKKYIRENHPSITHWFDVWHVAKGVFKKLSAAGKKKGCEKVALWARSICNHIYWCAASSKGDRELILAKWKSITNHIANVHEGHGEKFSRCEHGDIADKEWMLPGYKPHFEVSKIVTQPVLLRDIPQLSPAEQTSSLEAFHKVVCHFAPKLLHYGNAQMESRLFLAVLHFNENGKRAQAENSRGEKIFAVSYPRGRTSDGVAKAVRVPQTFEYVDELMQNLIAQRLDKPSYSAVTSSSTPKRRPPPLSRSKERVAKDEIVNRYRSRFNA